jgi:nucleoside-diphosphate-sugar epimerase
LVFINNFIDGIWLTIVKDDALNNTFNINDGYTITYKLFYSTFASMLGIKKLPSIPEWRVRLSKSKFFSILRILLKKPSMKQYVTHFRFNKSEFSISKAKEILHYNPQISFEKGISLTEKWLKQEAFLD